MTSNPVSIQDYTAYPVTFVYISECLKHLKYYNKTVQNVHHHIKDNWKSAMQISASVTVF